MRNEILRQAQDDTRRWAHEGDIHGARLGTKSFARGFRLTRESGCHLEPGLRGVRSFDSAQDDTRGWTRRGDVLAVRTVDDLGASSR